jgi:uncharacterized SAM-binding protein YcdF (DUF218 family)
MMDTQAIDSYLFVEDREIEADFTIVLGITLWHRPLARALKLYKSGVSGTLILSGGHNAKLSTSEASEMYARAILWGVDDKKILCDRLSTNTHENFLNSFNLISGATGSRHLAINIVAINYHMRRALLTARKVLPEGTLIGTASYPSVFFSDKNWHQCERGRKDVSCELEKIRRYFPAQFPAEMLSF